MIRNTFLLGVVSLGTIFVPGCLGSNRYHRTSQGVLLLEALWTLAYQNVMYGAATVATAVASAATVALASSSPHSNQHLNSFLSKSTFPSLKHHRWFYYF